MNITEIDIRLHIVKKIVPCKKYETDHVTLQKSYRLTARNKKLFSYLIKVGIIALAFFYVYHDILKYNDNLQRFKELVAHISYNKVFMTLAIIILLMVINYVLESFKWWYLTRVLFPITIWQAIGSVFCGLTWAVFTPNRIGEYGGRVMFLPVRRRIHGMFAMAVGSFSQNVITNVLGSGALVWFLYRYIPLNQWLLLGITLVAVGFMAVMLIFYFNIKWMVWLLNRIRFLKKFHRFFDIMGKYNTGQLLKIMCFSMARFFVFTFQYYLVIHLLLPQIPLLLVTLLMFAFFFIQSAIPSLDLLDIGVRSLTAATLFGYVTDQTIAVIVAVSIIYVVNFITPAVIGSVFVFKLKFFDRTA